ncbi:IS21-like element helper ATPase IstB [Sphingobacterium faecium]|uniref:IS21-like element helper ATPase IstB n=1 Tax=Sphingobacterium faecium TaxID=34087 RepID=UPI000D3B109A|nr:IS21-like element helper ATPase IstB [Sphingobacterium faecium]PTX10190.1 DNA replication protein DnaC [Sphingobacterium faecium]WGQ16715.1 IS21-like element helper ATPase IstB [Sphingobacterium faecium]
MNIDQTIEQLRSLRLAGMAKRYEAVAFLPVHELQDIHELLGSMVHAEVEYREHGRTQKYLKASRLRYNALPEEILCSSERGITREMILRLSDGTFIQRGENVLITGSTGSGKSFLACALGRSACLLGYRTLYFGMNRFMDTVVQTRLDGTYLKWIKGIANQKLLILDDFGLKSIDADTRLALLDLLEDRYGNSSVIITSQLPVEAWYNFIDEPTLADAIMDRLTASSHRLPLQGKSLRKKKNN